MWQVLDRLRQHGMVLNGKKCVLSVSEIDYLGHRITASGVLPMQQRVAAIREHGRLSTARGLQTYLGMVNFYRRFLPAAARVLRLLTDALKGAPKGALSWSMAMERAIVESKVAMLSDGGHLLLHRRNAAGHDAVPQIIYFRDTEHAFLAIQHHAMLP